MSKNIFSVLSFALAFVFILLGGYQCATRVTEGTRQISGPWGNPNAPSYTYEDHPDEGTVLPSIEQDEPLAEEQDSCPRAEFNKLAKDKYLGEQGILNIKQSSLKDYRFDEYPNFPLNCARIYLNMEQISGTSTYKGQLAIAYSFGDKLKWHTYSSGDTKAENQYNKWTGTGQNKKFYAIFEDTHRAIILRLLEVHRRDVRDGSVAYIGEGKIYFKMFRVYDPHNKDACYRTGNYVKDVPKDYLRNAKCWLLHAGPFSCRPKGVLHPRAQNIPRISLSGNLNCYTEFGIFGWLDTARAFNMDNVAQFF